MKRFLKIIVGFMVSVLIFVGGYYIVKTINEDNTSKITEFGIDYADVNYDDLSGVLADNAPRKHKKGETTVLQDASKTDWDFAGWHKNKYGLDAVVAQLTDTDFGTGKDIVLYASWTPQSKEYTVTLDPNGGLGEVQTFVATYGQPLPSGLAAPSREGFEFVGYFYTKDFGGTQYYDEHMQSVGVWDKTQDTVLYARWVGAEYVLTIDPNGGVFGDDGTSDARDFAVNYLGELPLLSGIGLTKSGQTLVGIALADGTNAVPYYDKALNPLSAWDKDGDGVLVAMWKDIEYTVQYEGNGADGGAMPESLHTASVPSALRANAYTKTGDNFLGWAQSADASQAEFADETEVDFSQTQNIVEGDVVVLYAVWQEQDYTVSLFANGGEFVLGSSDDIQVDIVTHYNKPLPTLESVHIPVLTGQIFVGFWDSVDGQGKQYYNAEGVGLGVWDKATDGALYAQWQDESVVYKDVDFVDDGSGGWAVQAKDKKNMPSVIRIPSVYQGKEVTKILERGFWDATAANNTTIQEVVIGEGVKVIGDDAFAYCQKLAKVTLPSTSQVIKSGAFGKTLSLKTIDLPTGLQRIESSVFNASKLVRVEIPHTVEFIGDNAFSDMGTLGEIVFLESTDASQQVDLEIAGAAFACENVTSLVLPKRLVSVGDKSVGRDATFQNTFKLKDVYLQRDINDGLVVAYKDIFTIDDPNQGVLVNTKVVIHTPNVETQQAYQQDAFWGTYNIVVG
ncbi:MAG: leucine-rich repeat protein [Firmicutes bacterium]|nr:leucine-rich repeat protein [Bacillota bacterium]